MWHGEFAQPAFAQPAFAQPAFAQPAFAQPAFAQPAFAQPAFAQPAFAQPAFTQPAFTQPAFAQPAFAQPAFALAQPSPLTCPAASALSSPLASLGVVVTTSLHASAYGHSELACRQTSSFSKKKQKRDELFSPTANKVGLSERTVFNCRFLKKADTKNF